jgi:hypothetical protein
MMYKQNNNNNGVTQDETAEFDFVFFLGGCVCFILFVDHAPGNEETSTKTTTGEREREAGHGRS